MDTHNSPQRPPLAHMAEATCRPRKARRRRKCRPSRCRSPRLNPEVKVPLLTRTLLMVARLLCTSGMLSRWRILVANKVVLRARSKRESAPARIDVTTFDCVDDVRSEPPVTVLMVPWSCDTMTFRRDDTQYWILSVLLVLLLLLRSTSSSAPCGLMWLLLVVMVRTMLVCASEARLRV